VDLIELLTTRFGLDVASLARSLGIPRQTLQRIGQNHAEMLRLLVETAAR
jgi:plasmid maintenance system antidote protein VapI